jgi:hypothetical protein
MIALARRSRSLRATFGVLAVAVAVWAAGCGPDALEIPIETPIQPKLDVSPFERVLVAGFVAGGTEGVDTNQETVRLLRSQLRTKSGLKVVDSEIMPLANLAQDQARANSAELAGTERPASGPNSDQGTTGNQPLGIEPLPTTIKTEKDLEPYERLFANAAYWKKIGEEYQNPLIVTGTVLFTPQSRSGFVQREQEVFDQFGRRRVVPVRTYTERAGFILRPKFVFIDGRSGALMYSETYREEILYNAQQNTPALSSYFELMDRVLPNFLGAFNTQRIKGTRVLLK